MLIDSKGKNFEKPDSGMFVAVLADIVYIKDKPTQYGPKDKSRLIWILDAKDKEGNYYRVMTEATSSMNEKARLFGLVKDIRNGVVPPIPFELDELIGSVNRLVISREKSPDGTKDYANIKAIIPALAGTTFAVPAGFVRAKDKPVKTNTAAAGTTTAPATAPAASAPVQSPAPAASAAAPAEQNAEIQF